MGIYIFFFIFTISNVIGLLEPTTSSLQVATVSTLHCVVGFYHLRGIYITMKYNQVATIGQSLNDKLFNFH